ncbi:MAG: Fe-S cluster assembly protein SufD [Bacteroidota bacterium]
MSVMTDQKLRMEDRFQVMYEQHNGHALNGSNASLTTIRQDAIEDFAKIGLPHKKTEAWKYTRIEKALSKDVQIQLQTATSSLQVADLAPFQIPELDAYRVVFLNGHMQPALGDLNGFTAGVTLTDLCTASTEHADLMNPHFAQYANPDSDAFVALNTAFAKDGLFLHVPQRTVLDKPIHVIHLFDMQADQMLQPRMLFVAEAGSQVKVIESFASLNNGAATFVNSVTEWVVEARAHVDHYQLQEFGEETTVVADIHAQQAATSFFSTHTTSLTGKMIRNNLTIVPDAEDCESHLFGFVLGKNDMHVDNHTLVDHKKPNCFSNELYKNILDDASTGIFNGKVFVRPDAQKINAYQSNKSITLTPKAQMYSKPELEIYADDVRCSHGATTGQLDEDALFYLRARGINETQARSLLLMAFARDVIDNIKIEPLRAFVDDKIAARL